MSRRAPAELVEFARYALEGVAELLEPPAGMYAERERSSVDAARRLAMAAAAVLEDFTAEPDDEPRP